MVNRGDRSEAVLNALQPICDDAADLVTALSDTLVSIYIVGAEDCMNRAKMQMICDLFVEKTMGTYDGFMEDRGDVLRKILREEMQ